MKYCVFLGNKFSVLDVIKKGIKISIIFITSALFFTFAIAQDSQKKSKNSVLFYIGDEPCYLSEFVDMYKANHSSSDDFTKAKVIDYLDLYINFRLKVKEAEAEGMDTTKQFLSEFNSYKSEFKKSFLGEKKELSRLTKEAYDRLLEAIKVSYILLVVGPNPTPKDTLEAYKKIWLLNSKILNGETFEAVADEVALDRSTESQIGSTGLFTALQTEYPIENAAFQLKVGEVSPPVRTEFGFQIMKVTDRIANPGKIETSQIFLHHGNGLDEKKVQSKIFEIYDKAIDSVYWEELKNKYSEGYYGHDLFGRRLNTYIVGEKPLFPELGVIALTLKEAGQISKPIRSDSGWHILRLERKSAVPSFDEIEPLLQRKVIGDGRMSLVNQRVAKEKKNKYNFVEDSTTVKLCYELADSSFTDLKLKNDEIEKIKDKQVFQIKNNKYVVNDFIDFVKKRQDLANGFLTQRQKYELYNDFVATKLDQVEENILTSENKEFRRVISEYKNGILLFSIMEKNVWNKSLADSVEMEKYFEENIEKYPAKERVKARMFIASDEKFFSYIKDKINSGDSLTEADLSKFKSVIPYRNYERGENKIIDSISWTVGIKYVEADKNFYIVEVETLLPEGLKTFEEAKIQVLADFQDKLEKDWLLELRKKYPATINKGRLKSAINRLTKK